MKDKLYTALVAVAVVIVSVSASTLTVDRLTDHTNEQFKELGKLDLRIKAQEKDLEKTETDLKNQSIEIESQNKSLRTARTKIDALLEEATGLEGQDASKRLEQVKALADAIGSSDNLNLLLGLQSRVDALTNSDLMACSETIEYGRAQSCREHNDWIPRASCPPGRFIRSINIVAMKLPRFGGHLNIAQRRCPDVEETTAVRAGVPAPDGGAGSHGAHARGAGPRVRVLRVGDP